MQGERVRVVGLCGADSIYNGQNGIIVEWSNDRGKVGTRSLGSSGGPFNGLASMDPRGSLVAFACAPGAKSIELPREPHGIYTHHLLKHLETPGLEINALFIRIGNAVEQATQHLPQPQRPYVNHCLRCETASLFPNPSPIRQDVTGVGIGGDGGGGVGNSAQPDARATGATMHA